MSVYKCYWMSIYNDHLRKSVYKFGIEWVYLDESPVANMACIQMFIEWVYLMITYRKSVYKCYWVSIYSMITLERSVYKCYLNEYI